MPDARKKSRLKTLTLIIVWFGVLFAGIWMTKWRADNTGAQIKESILNHTKVIASAINPDLVKELEFKPSDSVTPEFNRIRNQMTAYGSMIGQRGIYSMAIRDGKIYFGPETYLKGDPLASRPGEEYLQPSSEDFQIFSNARPLVMDPFTDEYGTFISALAPVLDPSSGKVLMVVGMDVPIADWKQQINKSRILPMTGTFITLVIIAAGFLLIRKRQSQPEAPRARLMFIETYLVAVVGLFVTVIVSLIAREYEDQVQNNLFRMHSLSRAVAISGEFDKVENDLILLEDFFLSSQFVDSLEFESFTKPLSSRMGSVVYMWAPCVIKSQVAAFESYQRKAGMTSYTIHSGSRDGSATARSDRPYYYPLLYIKPKPTKRFVYGLDLLSDTEYARVIEIAGHNHLLIAANPESRLYHGERQTFSLVINQIVKSHHRAAPGSDIGMIQDSGCILALINVQNLMASSMLQNDANTGDVLIELIDLMNPTGPTLLGSSSGLVSEDPLQLLEPDFHKRYTYLQISPLFVFGRTMAVVLHPSEQYLNSHKGGIWLIIGGFLAVITLILVKLIHSQQSRQTVLKNTVLARTAELVKAKEKAEESDRLKSSLLLNLSHELRTPLNGILGFGEILIDRLNEPDNRKMASNIVQLGKRLFTTFTSMLKLSQLEAEQRNPDFAVWNVSEILRSEVRNFKGRAAMKRISIKEMIDENVYLRTDKTMLHDILFFLIDNALKFTNSGYVWISLHQIKEDGLYKTEFRIKDSGIGIRPEQYNLIFQAFRQGSEGIGRSHDGPGLGLTLCKRYADLLGAEIQVESVEGTGSSFNLIFRAAELPEIKEGNVITDSQPINSLRANVPAVPEKVVRVLVVEDNQPNAELIVQYLGKKFIADVASTGKLAIKYAYQNDYDLILMDINLGPEMDGIRAAQEIRAIKNYGRLPIIAVTGYSTNEEKENILNQGLSDFISKPFTKTQLFETLNKHLQW